MQPFDLEVLCCWLGKALCLPQDPADVVFDSFDSFRPQKRPVVGEETRKTLLLSRGLGGHERWLLNVLTIRTASQVPHN